MIDLEKKLDQNMVKVRTYILDRINTYYGSRCFRLLKSRVARLDDSIDMRFHESPSRVRQVNMWKSKIAMPLGREAYLARRAVTISAFRNDPLVAVSADADTPSQNAANVEMVLSQNFRSTKFRQKCFRNMINYCSRYGSTVVVSSFKRLEERYKTTMRGAFGYERMAVVRPHNNVLNTDVHPLNYFQDSSVADPEQATFRGYIERIALSELVADVKANPDLYIKNEVEEVIKAAKKDFSANRNYYDNTQSRGEHASIGVDRVHWYGKISIDGNEESGTIYYVQLIGDHIIRLEENPHDENLVPINCCSFDKRLNFWWGNVDTENVLPHENFMQLIMSMAADEGIRNLERYIFYDAGAIDIADINNRHKSGGWIPFDGKGQPARNFFGEFQPTNSNALNGLQYLMQEMKESAQRVRPKGDLTRQGLKGGIRNETATAAMMLDEQQDMLESDLLESFSFGLIGIGETNAIMLRQHLPEAFQIRPDGQSMPIMMSKDEILGKCNYMYNSALTKNKQIQAQNLLNWLTFMQNMRGTGDPSWLNVNMSALIKELFRRIDIGMNLQEVYPEQQKQMVPGLPMIPGMQNGMTTPAAPMALPSPQEMMPPQPQQEMAYA